MRETVTVSLPAPLRKALDRISRSEGVSRSDVIRESLRDYLFFRHFRQLRGRLVKKAARKGLHSDADVFDRIS